VATVRRHRKQMMYDAGPAAAIVAISPACILFVVVVVHVTYPVGRRCAEPEISHGCLTARAAPLGDVAGARRLSTSSCAAVVVGAIFCDHVIHVPLAATSRS